MSWKEAAFGKILYKDFSRFKYSRIPKITREYFITTRGLVIRGGGKGPGDLLAWDRIKEPGTSDGAQLLGIDFAGTVRFNTPITLSVLGGGRRGGKRGDTIAQKEFPEMSTDFYYKLMSAWRVANMFSSESIRTKALIIWSKNKNMTSDKSRGEYEKKICECKIDDLFRGRTDYKNAALEMYEKGKLKLEDCEKTDYEIEKMVKEYWQKERKIGFKTRTIGFQTSASDAREDFIRRVDARGTVNTQTSQSRDGNFYTRKWSDAVPHPRYGHTNDGRND